MFTAYLQYARQCGRSWRENDEQNRVLALDCILAKETKSRSHRYTWGRARGLDLWERGSGKAFSKKQ